MIDQPDNVVLFPKSKRRVLPPPGGLLRMSHPTRYELARILQKEWIGRDEAEWLLAMAKAACRILGADERKAPTNGR